jgi:hypothetical protein
MSKVAAAVAYARSGVRAGAPPSGSLWLANLPSGLTLRGDTFFGDILNGEVLNAAGFSVPGTQAGVSSGALRTDVNKTDATAPYAPNVYEYGWPEGDTGNGQTISSLFGNGFAGGMKRIYVCFDLWLSPNYVTHTGQEKLWYPITNGTSNALNMAILGGGTAAGPAGLCIQPQTSGFGTQFALSPTAFITKGEWQQIEVEMVMNTPSATDAQLRVWHNGDLVWEITDNLNFGGSNANPAWVTPRLDGTRGGGVSTVPVPAGGMSRRFSRLTLYSSATL